MIHKDFDEAKYSANLWSQHRLGVEIENLALTIERSQSAPMTYMTRVSIDKLLKIASELK
jgi:hypothetical protein